MSEPDTDPRRELWRRGSYEIVGEWLAPASLSVLDRVAEVVDSALDGCRLLDVATGTGTVAIEAARRGAVVTAVDLTEELVDIARRRADDAGVDVQFTIGDFDHLDHVVGDAEFDVITSAFGVIFAPNPAATLAGLERRLAPGGSIGVAGWGPDGVFVVPASMLDLMPERPRMPDMESWTMGITSLCEGTGLEVVSTAVGELIIPFASVEDAAEQLERWSGGWAQLFEMFDGLGVGREARARFVDHLASFSDPTDLGIGLHACHHASVLRRAS